MRGICVNQGLQPRTWGQISTRRRNTGGAFVRFLIVMVLIFVFLPQLIRCAQEAPQRAADIAAEAGQAAGDAIGNMISRMARAAWDGVKNWVVDLAKTVACKLPGMGKACSQQDIAGTLAQASATDRKAYVECLETHMRNINDRSCPSLASCGPSDLRAGSRWLECEKNIALPVLGRSDIAGLADFCISSAKGRFLSGDGARNMGSSAKRTICSQLLTMAELVRKTVPDWTIVTNVTNELNSCVAEPLWNRPCDISDSPVTSNDTFRTDDNYRNCIWRAADGLNPQRCNGYMEIEKDPQRWASCVITIVRMSGPRSGVPTLAECQNTPWY